MKPIGYNILYRSTNEPGNKTRNLKCTDIISQNIPYTLHLRFFSIVCGTIKTQIANRFITQHEVIT